MQRAKNPTGIHSLQAAKSKRLDERTCASGKYQFSARVLDPRNLMQPRDRNCCIARPVSGKLQVHLGKISPNVTLG